MSETDVEVLLQEGITAVKRGDKENGRKLLMEVLDIDDRNEKAWLWLSGAVESSEDRIICLENVLTINPDNKTAQKGLAKFTSADKPAEGTRIVVQREKVPVSTASAILYPERHVETLEWSDPTPEIKPTEQVGYAADDSYDDVWKRKVDICAYCAYEVAFDETKCPQCKRNLIVKQYQYEKESTSLTAYWVTVFGLSQLYLIQALVDVIVVRNLLTAFFSLVMMVVFFLLAVGIYFRKNAAFVSSMVLLIAVVITGLLTFLLPVDLSALNLGQYDISISNYVGGMAGGFYGALRGIRLVTAVVGLFIAIFQASSDFEYVHKKQLATLTKGPTSGADYHITAKKLANADMWASAILHWQRACALEPTQIIYQRDLGRAYAHLGFTQRAQDVLQSALARTQNEVLKVEIQETLDTMSEIKDG